MIRLIVILSAFSSFIFGQVLITSPAFSFTETFGSSGPATWTDNTSYLGWYYNSSNNTYGGYINITAAGPSNTGGLYTYQCSGGGNVKLGTRPSSGTGTIRYGLRLRNNSGLTIQSISVGFDFFQFSLSQNGNNANTVSFSYLQAATANNLTAGGFINVPALNFTNLQNDATCGSNQINGYPCTQSGTKVATCINVTIPIGQEILLRWTVPDNSCNDIHLGIDNVVVNFYSNSTVNPNTACSPLPIELSDFYGYRSDNSIALNWQVKKEINLGHYLLERSHNAIDFTGLAMVSPQMPTNAQIFTYRFSDESPIRGINYYRLTNVDLDGSSKQHPIIAVQYNGAVSHLWHSESTSEITIGLSQINHSSEFLLLDMAGKTVRRMDLSLGTYSIPKSELATGMYYIKDLSGQNAPYKLMVFN